MKRFYPVILFITLIAAQSGYAQVAADFSASTTTGCDQLSVNFTDLSTEATSWQWDFGDGNSSTAQNPSNTYASPGSYTVKLTASDAFGSDTETKSSLIIVHETPDVSFTLDENFGCNELNINPTNNTTVGTDRTYSWDFGDGNSSTLRSPSHTYSAEGIYTVSLVVTESGSCIGNTFEQTASVESLIADFEVPAITCLETQLEFENTSNGDLNNVAWDFGDGNTGTSNGGIHTYETTGTFNVNLSVTSATGCTSVVQKSATINPLPTAAFDIVDDQFCTVPVTISVSDASTSDNGAIVNWLWGTGGESANGISTTDSFTPEYSTYGFKRIELTVTDEKGCIAGATSVKAIKIFQPEVKLATDVSNGCTPLDVAFSDNSITNSGNFSGWDWDFGNGQSSSDQNPSITYADTGAFDITLTVTTDEGCTNTATFTSRVTAGIPPTGAIAAADNLVCQADSVEMSQTVSSYTDYWYWGHSPTGNSVSFTTSINGAFSSSGDWKYMDTDTGYFDVELRPAFHGCQGDIIHVDSAYRILTPISIIQASQEIACEAPLAINISDSSIAADTYQWNLGILNSAGTGDSLINQKDLPQPFTYQEQGVYILTLTTTATTFGKTCSNVDTTYIGVAQTQPIISNFTPVSGCTPLTDTVYSGSLSNTPINEVLWELGFNGQETSADSANSVLTATTPGFHDLTLTITDSLGCEFSTIIEDAFEVKGLPAPDFELADTSGCTLVDFDFINNSAGDNGANIVAQTWHFGDDSLSTALEPSHRYLERNVYSVKLIATDEFGCVDSITKENFLVAAQPYVSAVTDKSVICDESTVTFTPTISTLGNQDYGLSWDFGDGNGSSDTIVTNLYSIGADTTQFAIYSVTVTNLAHGCDSIYSDTIEVSIPQANFVLSDTLLTCYPDTINVTNMSSADVVTWEYDLGAGNTSADADPQATYVSPDTLNASLVVINDRGCSDTLSLTDRIMVQGPTGSYSLTLNAETCERGYTMQAEGLDTDSMVWFIDDGIGGTETYGDSVYYYFIDAGSYHPTVTLTDTASGCEITLSTPTTGTGDLEVPESDVTADFTVSNEYPDQRESVQFEDFSSSANGNIINVEWDLGDTTLTFTSAENFQFAFGQEGEKNVSLTVTDVIGCTDVAETTLQVLEAFAGYNALTPDGDGLNDCLTIELYGATRYNLQIFNRSGQIVYESICVYDVSWCGEDLDGDFVPDGTYYYIAQTVDLTGDFNTARGFISVMGSSGN